MPGYEKEDYDTGGDSFGQIFSDLVTGAASAAVSGGVAPHGVVPCCVAPRTQTLEICKILQVPTCVKFYRSG